MRTLPQYKIYTKNNLTYLCSNSITLNKQLSLLGNNVEKIYKITKPLAKEKSTIHFRVTNGMRDKLKKRLDVLGIPKISEYFRLLFASDTEMEILKRAEDM